jgi:hypothetical protein
MTSEERRGTWYACFVQAGHVAQVDEDGNPDFFAFEWQNDWYGHNGPRCVKCGWADCEFCVPENKIPTCTKT